MIKCLGLVLGMLGIDLPKMGDHIFSISSHIGIKIRFLHGCGTVHARFLGKGFPFHGLMVYSYSNENGNKVCKLSGHFHLMSCMMGFCVENGYGDHSVI